MEMHREALVEFNGDMQTFSDKVNVYARKEYDEESFVKNAMTKFDLMTKSYGEIKGELYVQKKQFDEMQKLLFYLQD